MSRMNWELIASHVAEAREELERIESRLRGEKRPAEGELQVMFEHAYHHLNVAWTARRATTKSYARTSAADFNAWGRFPEDLEEWRLNEES